MRLDKYIASVTDYSRTEVKILIKRGEIEVNACTATQASTHIKIGQDQISLNGDTLLAPQARYFMLNKPEGTVCATQDSEHPTVIDLLDEPNLQKLQIVGRLDKDTTGLLLLTDDGQWNHRVTSPNKQCFKQYVVSVAENITPAMVQQLENGIVLKNETKPTLPAIVSIIQDNIIELNIQEGKYHQVKRMMAAVNNCVTALHRQKIGSIVLDKQLALGEYRSLSPSEVNTFNS